MKNKITFRLIVAVLTFFSSLYANAQDAGRTPEEIKMMHNETTDDPFLPNTNKKFSRSYKFKSPVELKLMETSIFTNQVNVSDNGQNILDDAANEPSIAIDINDVNKIAIGWRQFDNVISNFRQAGWAYTNDGGQTWTFPGSIDAGNFHSDPVLDYDSIGNFYYNSLRGDFSCLVYKSVNGGADWNEGAEAGGGDKQWMAVDRTGGEGNGNIYSSWSSYYSACSSGNFNRSADEGISFEDCIPIYSPYENPYYLAMTVDKTGNVYVAGGSNQTGYLVVAKSNNAQVPGSLISWEDPKQVFMDGFLNGWTINTAGLLGMTNIDADHSSGAGGGNIYLLAAMTRLSNADPGDIMFARSTDGGNTWSDPIQINDDNSTTNTQWFGTLSVAPNGRIDAVWLDTREANFGSDSSALYYSYSNDQGNTWSANEKLSDLFDPHIGYPNQQKIGDYYDMVSDNTGAHLAWANTLNGEQDVYYSHIVPPVTAGLSNNSLENKVNVFPNPTKGIFTLSGTEKQSVVEIYNTLGAKIFSLETTNPKISIDVSIQPSGIYFLKIIDENGNAINKKLVKE